ncbi:hypothetical protein AB0H82_20115 [Streptomyces sp. NPDC050732]
METALAAAHDASRALIEKFETFVEQPEAFDGFTAADGPGSLFARG